MIKANELRVGNWIQLGSFYVYVTSALINKNELDNYCGIPITPEILDKCGFVKSKEWWGEDVEYYHLPLNNCQDEFKSIDIMFGFETDAGILNGVYLGQLNLKERCVNLHQLQNLYFALTGEELQINL